VKQKTPKLLSVLFVLVASVFTPIAPASAAYAFTTHTFTPCGQTGQSGPSQASCRSAYSTTWDESDANFTVSSGIQIWTVPYTGLYRINAFGAAGSAGNGGTAAGGNGARVQGDFNLVEGDKIRILVGQMGVNAGYSASDGASGSGGGGTFVISGVSGTLDSQVLLIAAGGGGSNDPIYQRTNTAGLGGLHTSSGTGDGSNSGGSYRGTGGSGASFASGGVGGFYSRGGSTGTGGFGGGGATDDSPTGGGGWVGGTASVAAYSKNNGSNQSGISSTNSGAGSVAITSLGPSVTTFAPAVSLTNSANLSFNLIFSQSVTGVDSNDFTVVGTGSSTCIKGAVTGSGTTYTIPLTGCSQGTVSLTITANVATNGSSQTGPASNTNSSTAIIDTTAPTISTVTTTNGNYQATSNANLNFTVGFSESVTVTGTPRIPITIGSTTRYANFLSLTDSRTATFRFTVSVNYDDIDLNGIAVSSPLDLNSGTIADLATNAMTSLTFSPPVTTSVNVYQPPSAPTIDSITANNGSVTVYFTAGSSNGSAVSNYKYSLNSGAYTALSPTDSTSPITITGLTNGTNYQIDIKAVSNLGDGLASNSVASTPSASASVTIALTASATTATKGTTIVITANVSQAGLVTFSWNGKRIAGCINRTASSSATCNWKPAVTGAWTISALLDPTDPSYVNSTSSPLSVFITKRTNSR
jgi:hypothetical protein